MEVKAWAGGSGTFGIRVGYDNRDRYFHREWKRIEVELDGESHSIALTGGFWNKCPEFRSPVIRDWLRARKFLKWEKGNPPAFELLPLGGARFRLVG